MTERVPSTASDQPLMQNPSETLSGGGMLKKARESAGLHIGAMAVALKVPVKKLEALESDQFELLPDTVFVRALASSICRNLKIDPNPILERLPHTATPRLKTDEAGINTPFRETGDTLSLPLSEQLSKPMVLAVMLVLLGILVLVFVPFKGFGNGAKDSKVEGIDAVAVEPSDVLGPNSSAVIDSSTVVEPLRASSSPNVVESVVMAPLTSPVVPATPTVSEPVQIAPTPLSIPASVVASAGISLKARGSSWVEVVDAKGGVQVRKILAEGESIDVSGALPLSVVIGKADALEVQLHGKPFDLTRIAKENVARFEVK